MSAPFPPSPDSPEPVVRLLGAAGRRSEPPEEARTAVYLSTRVAWEDALRRRRRIRRTWLAAAASVAIVGLGLWLGTAARLGVGEPAASLVAQSIDAGVTLRVGEQFETSAGRGLTLATPDGHALRLDRASRVHATAPQGLELDRGRLYVDTAEGSSHPLVVATRGGRVTHVGTRFTVEATDDGFAVQVRDGRVRIETAATRLELTSGTRVMIDAGGRELTRRSIPRHGRDWDWVDALAPPLRLDGRSLLEVLEDIARQSGQQLEFAEEGLRRDCRSIELKGPLVDLPLSGRLFAVLVTTNLEAVESGERILIRRRTAASPDAPHRPPTAGDPPVNRSP